MRYTYKCPKCLAIAVIFRSVDDRDALTDCVNCDAKIKRVFSSPMVSKQLGCIMASERDGVGCMVGEDGKIYPAKNRGKKSNRIKNEQRKSCVWNNNTPKKRVA